MSLTIEYLTTDELKPYENNARIHDNKSVEGIKASIEQFGMNDPIGIWGDQNIIIEGHGRLLACQELGIKTVPCIRLDNLTDEQRRAYMLAHNKTAELSEWNIEKLMQELSELTTYDMDLFGFNTLPEMTTSESTDDFSIDEEYESIDIPSTKTNEIWKLGNHRLICGDCTDKAIIAKLTDGQMVDLLLTDPPYNVAVENSEGMTIENDDMTDEQFKLFLVSAFEAADSVMKEGAGFYIWHGETEGVNFRNSCNAVGWEIRQCLIWIKNQIIIGRQDYQWKHEPCLYGWKDGAAHFFIKNRKQPTVIDNEIELDLLSTEELIGIIKDLTEPSTVLRVDKPQKNTDHPTMKPVKLIKQQVKNSTKRGGIVLDIFGGSGTTLIACEELDRVCYMSELDPKYCDVIIKRWEALTGQKAELIN